MQAVIISVGDELTAGATLDTNTAYLARRLGDRGVGVLRHETVGDCDRRIGEAIARAAAQAELVIVTGGLGPTADDLTRRGLAAAMGVELIEDARSLERISGFFAARGRQMKPSNRTQAMVPAGAEAIDNDCGTAPGIAAEIGPARVFVLPGPPHEMTEMFEKRIACRLPRPGAIIRRVLHVFGEGESTVGERIAEWMGPGRNPAVGTTVSAGIISVRITASGPTDGKAAELADAAAGDIRRRLGRLIFGADRQSLAGVVGQFLRSAGETLAVAESCTGGMIGQLVTAAAGASDYFLGGVVAYADEAKTALLGVPPELLAADGAVSEPVCAEMAQGARRRFGADWGVSVTGIAGPAGGSDEKPVGLVYIGLAGPDQTAVHRHVLSGTRDIVRRRAALTALNHLRLALIPDRDDA